MGDGDQLVTRREAWRLLEALETRLRADMSAQIEAAKREAADNLAAHHAEGRQLLAESITAAYQALSLSNDSHVKERQHIWDHLYMIEQCAEGAAGAWRALSLHRGCAEQTADT